MTRAALFAVLAALSGCLESDTRAVVYYNISNIPASGVDDHYHHYASIRGGVADLGCFVVEPRQINCFDFDVDPDGNATPNIYDALVECACPCTESTPDPCDSSASPAPVTAGTIRGTLESFDAILNRGGAEFPIDVDLGDAEDVFITRNPDDATGPEPGDVVLSGDVARNGSVLTGTLTSPASQPGLGRVTIVPVEDGADL